MCSKTVYYCFIALSLLSVRFSVFAATSVSFTGVPSTIDQSQEFEADVSLICTGCSSDSYMRGIFYPSGTSYFGYTQNNSGVWINTSGSGCTEYFKIVSTDLVEGSWSGKLKFKPDIESTFYSGPGEFLFKIGRYTASCGTPTWSTEKTITITGPTATPTNTPTNTPTSSPTSAPTSFPTLVPTKTPTITPTAAKTPTSSLSKTPTRIPSETFMPSPTTGTEEEILGAQSSPWIKNKPYIIALVFISIGLAFLGAAFFFKNRLYSNHA